MIKVIEKGKMYKSDIETMRFICCNCECVFEADSSYYEKPKEGSFVVNQKDIDNRNTFKNVRQSIFEAITCTTCNKPAASCKFKKKELTDPLELGYLVQVIKVVCPVCKATICTYEQTKPPENKSAFKRYLLFVFHEHAPKGGILDFAGDYLTLTAVFAKIYSNEKTFLKSYEYSKFQIVDTEKKKFLLIDIKYLISTDIHKIATMDWEDKWNNL